MCEPVKRAGCGKWEVSQVAVGDDSSEGLGYSPFPDIAKQRDQLNDLS